MLHRSLVGRLAGIALLIAGGYGGNALGQMYGGPAILSRGELPGTEDRSALFGIRPFVSVYGIWDTGWAPVGLDAQGKPLNGTPYGVDGTAGVTGYHTWKDTTLGLTYTFEGRHYTNNPNYDALNQDLALNFSSRISRRVAINVQEAAGIHRGDTWLLGSAFVDPSLVNIPTNEMFDDRVYYQSTYTTLTYQMTRRLSFSAGGNEFLAQYHAGALISGYGYGAHGDISYRLNKNSTVTTYYNFTHYGYAHSFGAADFHTFGLAYARRIGRAWQLSIAGGANRVEVQTVALIPIDPVIAAIIGQNVGVQAVYRLNYLPNVDARLSRSFRHSSFGLSYSEGMSPGNGIYLASSSRAGGASFSYNGFRNVGLSAGMSYTRYGDLMQTIGAYDAYDGTLTASYRIFRSFSWTMSGGAMEYTAGNNAYSRRTYHAQAGLMWSPGETPISFK